MMAGMYGKVDCVKPLLSENRKNGVVVRNNQGRSASDIAKLNPSCEADAYPLLLEDDKKAI